MLHRLSLIHILPLGSCGDDKRLWPGEGVVDHEGIEMCIRDSGVTGEKPQFFFLERYMDAYGKEMVQFIDAIENDTETPLGVEDGLKPVLMGLAAKKSVEEGRPVKISEIEF